MGILNPQVTLVKLGGSLITQKDRPLTLNAKGIRSPAKAISKTLSRKRDTSIMLVHGGGSFGHYYASKYRLTTVKRVAPAIGVSRVATSMLDLHSAVIHELVEQGVPCKSILTSELITHDGRHISSAGAHTVQLLLQSGFVPITFGNVSIGAGGTSIISGDRIALSLAEVLKIRRMIFAMDVDGIYADSDLNGNIIRELKRGEISHSKKRKFDVTGGLDSKIEIGFKLAELGTDVFYVNGLFEERLANLIQGRNDVFCTRINPNNI